MAETSTETPTISLTGALEDYLESIYELLLEHPFARVRDIAHARRVRAASVSPALKRLAAMGLVNYERREYVTLTEEGKREARRVYARHNLLTRFFHEILQMDREAASEEACAIEHCLSDEGMDRMVRFFEYLQTCPSADRQFLKKFHACSLVHDGVSDCGHHCPPRTQAQATDGKVASIYDLQPGQSGIITQVHASGAIRQRLLDMGILPATLVQMERTAPTGEPVWIRLHGSQIALRRQEAEAVWIEEQ
jgi:DtxR family transcriptional regulator, Mn-dependent transcriptional regulator